MKALVLYRSISGFTRKYAEWIAEELDAKLLDCRKARAGDIAVCELLVFGGSLHAVGINGIEILKRRWEDLGGKRIIVFATGASPDRDEIPEEIVAANFTAGQRERIRFFYLRGGFDYGRLDPVNKVLMSLLRLRIRAKKEGNRLPDEKGMLAAFDRPLDFTRKENIRPLVECAREKYA